MDRAAKIREATAKRRKARRDAGEVPKERWAHPDDWPELDRLFADLAQNRRHKVTTSALGRLLPGWDFRIDGDGIVISKPGGDCCAVYKDPEDARLIPERILFALAVALIPS